MVDISLHTYHVCIRSLKGQPIFGFYPQNLFVGRMRLVVQPGGLTLGFALHLVVF